MKIDNSIKPAGGAGVSETSRNRSAGKPSSAAPSTSAADVHLSGISTGLMASDETVSVDTARVAEIKQAISEGRFTINAGAIADRLINTAKELVDSQRRT